MENDKRESIIRKLKTRGLIGESVYEDLLFTFDEFIETLAKDELLLLEEIERIDEKINNNETLTFLEKAFFNFFLESYKTR